MCIVFTLGAVRIWALGYARHHALHVHHHRRAGLFTWGEIFSLFPSTCTDTFGTEIRHHQCRPALHRQGHVGLGGAARQRAETTPAAGMRCSWWPPS